MRWRRFGRLSIAPHYTTIQTHDGSDWDSSSGRGPGRGSCRAVYARAVWDTADRCGHARDRS